MVNKYGKTYCKIRPASGLGRVRSPETFPRSMDPCTFTRGEAAHWGPHATESRHYLTSKSLQNHPWADFFDFGSHFKGIKKT